MYKDLKLKSSKWETLKFILLAKTCKKLEAKLFLIVYHLNIAVKLKIFVNVSGIQYFYSCI